ncbi:uncharacterized protein PAC_13253 [Phialocephala subalpina]|uniref:Uncharacterized protein n=1 Tax=Phialocephala subalpina TaxID=576137 RepID=A0A1L7XEG0_9HELO|nr:uncharacterized protein PAC_13253 [Phialocephala subalpina]
MDLVYRFRDSVVEYLSPKRRRTVGPTTPSKDDGEPMFDAPASEPQGSKAQTVVMARVTKTYIRNPRKRRFREDEGDTVVTLKPEDSISQVGPTEESEEEEEEEEASRSGEEGSDADEEGGESDLTDADSEEVDGDEMEIEAEDEGQLEVGSDELDAAEISSDQEAEADDEDSDALIDGESQIDEAEIEAHEAAVADAKVKEYLAQQAELALRREDIEKAKAAGDWHPDALVLFERLSLRSFEVILPDVYKMDFKTLPEDLFALPGEDTFVNYNCKSYGYGVKALQGLLRLGVRARDKMAAVGSAEKLIAKGIQDYIKWSERDGGYHQKRFLPVLVVVAAKPHEATSTISAAIEDQMKFLAERHRENLALDEEHINEVGQVEKYRRQPPLLYGIIVARTMVIFTTMDAADPEAKVKHLTHFDFKDKPMDVWNGFAIAYTVIMARNYTMSIKDELEDEPEETDVDL